MSRLHLKELRKTSLGRSCSCLVPESRNMLPELVCVRYTIGETQNMFSLKEQLTQVKANAVFMAFLSCF